MLGNYRKDLIMAKNKKESKAVDQIAGAQNQENIISIVNVNKSYDIGEEKLHVLKDINLTVKKGEFLAILGPSGSGKSTLMNIIGCMDVADNGEYYLDGKAIHKTKEKKLNSVRNTEIGFVFQKYHLIPTYTVVQNIVMPLIVRGLSYSEAEQMSMETIEMLGLSDRLSHRPSELSGGQQQRVAIARALVSQPAILLADEPTGALDTTSGQEVLKLFDKLNSLGHTIVMITHDLGVAKAARRTVRIVDGELFDDQVV